MKEISLTQGQVALVDDSDFDFLNQWNWCAQKCRHTFYAVRTVWTNTATKGKKSHCIKMHRLIMQAPKGVEVDHKNHTGTDNQKHNLRLATRLRNSHNQRKHKDNTSGFIGGYKVKSGWMSQIRVRGKLRYLGTFSTVEKAADVRDEASLKYFGEFAVLNLPKLGTI